jgi:hypothetical protein
MSASTTIAPRRWPKGPLGRVAKTHGERENNAPTKTLQTKEQRGHIYGVSSKLTWKEGFLEHKSIYRKQKTTSTPQVDVEELKRQLRRELLGDLKPLLREHNSLTLLGHEQRRA